MLLNWGFHASVFKVPPVTFSYSLWTGFELPFYLKEFFIYGKVVAKLELLFFGLEVSLFNIWGSGAMITYILALKRESCNNCNCLRCFKGGRSELT